MRNVLLVLFPLFFLACENFSSASSDGDTPTLAEGDVALPDTGYDGWPVPDGDVPPVDEGWGGPDDGDAAFSEAGPDTDSDHDYDLDIDYTPPDSGRIVWMRRFISSPVIEQALLAVGGPDELFVAGRLKGGMNGEVAPSGACAGYKGYPVFCYDLYLSRWDGGGAHEWTRLTGTLNDDGIFAVAAAPGGGVLSISAGDTGVLFSKRTADGDLSWSRSLSAPERNARIVTAPTGDISLFTVVSRVDAASPTGTYHDLTLSRRSADGTEAWRKVIDTVDRAWTAPSFAAAPNGDILLASTIPVADEGSITVYEIIVSRYSSTGEPIWSFRWSDPDYNVVAGVAVDAAGAALVLGEIADDLFLFKISADGQLIWDQRWGLDQDDHALAVAATAGGNVLVVGSAIRNVWKGASVTPHEEPYVMTLDAAGELTATDQWNYGFIEGRFSAAALGVDGFLYLSADTGSGILIAKWAPVEVDMPDDTPVIDAEMPDVDTTGDEFSPGAMVAVPAGPFLMGCGPELDPWCDYDEYPFHAVTLDAFSIGKYEVTVGEYQECVDAGVCMQVGGEGGKHYDTNEFDLYCNLGGYGHDLYPMNCVTWYGANAYCAWKGQRLPTEAEWEKAARGVDGRRYPWGDEPIDCDHAVLATAEVYYGTPSDPAYGCGAGMTLPVGSKRVGVSPYGAYDMVGNVGEWVVDRYGANYYPDSPAVDPTGPAVSDLADMRVVRGGSYRQTADAIRATEREGNVPGNDLSYNQPGAFYFPYTHLGFRCAQ